MTSEEWKESHIVILVTEQGYRAGDRRFESRYGLAIFGTFAVHPVVMSSE